MKLTTISMLSAVSIALAGCTAVTNPFPGNAITTQDVVDASKAVCNYVPTAATIAEIVSNNNANVVTAADIAKAICALAGNKKGGRYGAVPSNVYIPPGFVPNGVFLK
jgi:hypothetical protein